MKIKQLLKSASLLALFVTAFLPTIASAQTVKTHPHPPVKGPVARPLVRSVRPAFESAVAATPPAPARKTPLATLLPAASPASPATTKNAPVHTSSLAREHHWRRHEILINLFVRPPVILFYQTVWPRYANLQPEADKLRAAYLALSRASFDYNGYRYAAMNQTRYIANNLGIALQDDGSGDETQEASDAEMDIARDLLGEAYDGFAAKGYPYSARQSEIAVNDISAALNEN